MSDLEGWYRSSCVPLGPGSALVYGVQEIYILVTGWVCMHALFVREAFVCAVPSGVTVRQLDLDVLSDYPSRNYEVCSSMSEE
ncbi:hypothetical protein BDZ91DRAFT_722273 [Kalaharituber pfeilii]|nr:hypothetical protein BDZ91DRAFT_722273 [Kalaharituber pfeilii]